jgi:hypothetical protein
MNRIGFLVGIFSLATILTATAFVTAVNNSNNTRRWNLLTPVSGLSTNLVNPNTKAIRYYLASDGYSATNTAAELNAVRAAFDQWQAVPNTHLKFEYAGLAPAQTSVNTSDTSNIVFWAKSSTVVPGAGDISGALGVTMITFGATDNIIRGADIVFNGVEHAWFTDYFNTSSTDSFVEGVALHEIGHLIGLLHSPLGAATMLWATSSGIGLQTGLHDDDIAAARFLYPAAATNYGAIRGTITKSGSPVWGAAVFARNAANSTVAGTVANASGNYLIGALPPGSYQIRVAPLDDTGTAEALVSGAEIGGAFAGADTAFLPTTNRTVTVTANATNVENFAVTAAAPPFRITRIRQPTTSQGSYSINRLPVSLRAGQSNRFIGVFSASLPTENATFTITGDGLTLGNPIYHPGNVFADLNGISMTISVASNATPGARDFIVTHSGNVASASGFLEIQGTTTDYNFDGLEDTFQRTYFPLFTTPEAVPQADPDGDTMTNYAEFIAGTNPTNAASVFKFLSVTRTNQTATLRWLGGIGKRYQVSYSTNLTAGPWLSLGSPVTAASTNIVFNDSNATNQFRHYRVQALP